MDDPISKPHDKLFKATFTRKDEAQSFFASYLPKAISRIIDWKTLELQPGSYIDEELNASESDLLYSARLKDKDCFIYLLFESQSKHCHMMAYRMLKYQVRIWEQFLKQNPSAKQLPLIFPLLLAHTKGTWRASRVLSPLIDLPDCRLSDFLPYIPDCEHLLVDLSGIPEDAIKGSLFGKMTQRLFKALRGGKISESHELIGEILKQANSESTLEMLRSYLRYILSVDSEIDLKEFIRKIVKPLEDTIKDEAMSIAEQLRTEGKMVGKAEGTLIGKILAFQEISGQDEHTEECLKELNTTRLKEILEKVRKQLKR